MMNMFMMLIIKHEKMVFLGVYIEINSNAEVNLMDHKPSVIATSTNLVALDQQLTIEDVELKIRPIPQHRRELTLQIPLLLFFYTFSLKSLNSFLDSGLSPRTKELSKQDSLHSGNSAEQVGIEDPEFSWSPKNSDFIDGWSMKPAKLVGPNGRIDALLQILSVISLQSDAPAIIDTETLPSTSSLASTEAGKSNVNNPFISWTAV
ncbi:unnamed protein product [Lupinus luteus]|uniref:Uncharacterized protein n=1 Tax=Lupinus luteus TaxID=3873 RepID=A0AAV1Y7D8_LUPLU